MDTPTGVPRLWEHNGIDYSENLATDIHHSIQCHIKAVETWPANRRTNVEAEGAKIKKEWWKLDGFKLNFGLIKGRFVICYK